MSKKKHMGLRFTSAALCLSILAAVSYTHLTLPTNSLV